MTQLDVLSLLPSRFRKAYASKCLIQPFVAALVKFMKYFYYDINVLII